MSLRISRRELLKDSAIVAGVAVGTGVFGVPALLAQRSPNSKLGMAVIGSNGRGMEHVPAAATQNLVALVDIDDGRSFGTVNWVVQQKLPKPKEYVDFRKMFDEIAQSDRRGLCGHARPHAYLPPRSRPSGPASTSIAKSP